MKNVIETYQKFQDTPTADSAFMEPFQSLESAELREDAAEAIKIKVLPGLKTIQDFLEKSYMANLRPDIAATSLPNGTAYYRYANNTKKQHIFIKNSNLQGEFSLFLPAAKRHGHAEL